MTSLTETVATSLDTIKSHFNEDELAYLALTQKVEHVVRDKLAYVLHKSLKTNQALAVCREWKRHDLAILEEGRPRLLLEAKAIYSFDIIKSGAQHQFPDSVAKDLIKIAKRTSEFAEEPAPDALALVIATHPHSAPREMHREAVKYYGGVRKYAGDSNSFQSANSVMSDRMRWLEVVRVGEIEAGMAFGVKVSVFFWLYRPAQVQKFVRDVNPIAGERLARRN